MLLVNNATTNLRHRNDNTTKIKETNITHSRPLHSAATCGACLSALYWLAFWVQYTRGHPDKCRSPYERSEHSKASLSTSVCYWQFFAPKTFDMSMHGQREVDVNRQTCNATTMSSDHDHAVEVLIWMSALFNFHALLTVIVLSICTCTYIHAYAPSWLDSHKTVRRNIVNSIYWFRSRAFVDFFGNLLALGNA